MQLETTKNKRFRIHPLWWPLLIILSPIIIPFILLKRSKYYSGIQQATDINHKRIQVASKMTIPEVERLDLTVIVDRHRTKGFEGDTGVSYLLQTDLGTTLFDVGYGPMNSAFQHNTEKNGISSECIDNIVISHLHNDHMGGLKAQKNGKVTVPDSFISENSSKKTCFVPNKCDSDQFTTYLVKQPTVLDTGMLSTGPLARMLFLMGYTEEQAVIVNVKDKGLVIITGCGHPTLKVILELIQKISDKPIYAIVGGLHFPIANSPTSYFGIEFQQLVGTGKPIWKSITDEDLDKTIHVINVNKPTRLLLSGHDTCDYSLHRIQQETPFSKTEVLTVGKTYKL